VVIDVADGTQIKAQPMRNRGRRGEHTYWKVRRYPGQAGFKVAGHTASGNGWATRPEIIEAIMSALAADAGISADVPTPDAMGRFEYLAAPDVSMTVADLVDMHLDLRERKRELRDTTMRHYRSAARRIREMLGDLRVVDVTYDVLERWAVRWMADKGVSGKSVQKAFTVLRPAMRWAVKTKRTPLATVPEFPRIEYTPKNTSRPPDRAALRGVFAALSEVPEVKRALCLQAHIGVRIGELWALRWRDVERKTVKRRGHRPVVRVSLRVAGKTGARTVPCSPAAVAQLEQMRAIAAEAAGGQAPALDEKIIGALAGPTSKTLSRRVSRALAKCGLLGEYRPNQGRALFGMELVGTGIAPQDYKAIMGHSITVALKHYLAPRHDSMFDAVAATDVGGHLEVDVTPLHGAGDEG